MFYLALKLIKMRQKVFKGLVREGYFGENYSTVFVGDSEQPFSKDFDECFSGKQVSVRYWVSGSEKEAMELKRNQLLKIVGSVQADYSDFYSDLTGYLWTDEHAKVGGHDLLGELGGSIGKYLYMEVDYE